MPSSANRFLFIVLLTLIIAEVENKRRKVKKNTVVVQVAICSQFIVDSALSEDAYRIKQR